MSDLVAISKTDSFMILKSVGIDVIVTDELNLVKEFTEASHNYKIIIYEHQSEHLITELMEKYDNQIYPIFLKLPIGKGDEDTLLELKKMVEKSIGISIV